MDILRERMAELTARAPGGILTPEIVVEDAKNPDSPLHGEFDWNLEAAAHKHWIERARELIREVTVIVKTERREICVPVYTRHPDLPGNKAGYIPVARLETDRDLARRAVIREVERVQYHLDRADRFAEAFGVKRDVQAIKSEVEKLAERVAA